MIRVRARRHVEAFTVDPPFQPIETTDTPEPRVQVANLEAIFDLGTELHLAGHLQEAAGIYLRILETRPQHARAGHRLGVTYHQLGEDDRALGYLERAAAVDRTNPELLRHLGETYRALHRLDEAARSFERALELEPGDAGSMCNLAHAYLQGGRFRLAERFYRRALAADGDEAAALTGLAVALTNQCREVEAESCYRRVLEIDPANHEARHMRDALRGVTPAAPAPEYVASLFDIYASSFDRHLVQTLRYDVPRLLRRAVDRVIDRSPGSLRILDLGCGTGLCGAAFRDLAATLSGVDLSPRMIDKARERGIYDTLIAGDLLQVIGVGETVGPAADPGPSGDPVPALAATRRDWDLVLAADVFVYVGDLAPVFAGVAGTLASGGCFAFSVERADDGYALRSSGRYAHSAAYVDDLAQRSGLAVRHRSEVAIRLEKRRELPGLVFVLERS